MDNKLTCEQQISQARVALLSDSDWRWMASVLMMGKTEYVSGRDAKVPTAATDGLNEIYNRDFIGTLNLYEVKFVVLHENMHKIFRHLFVWRNLYEQGVMVTDGFNEYNLANIACDCVINTQYLHGKKGLQFPKQGVHMPEYADTTKWNAKSIFDDLKKKIKEGQYTSKQQSHDYHDWEAAKELSKEEQQAIEKQVDRALRQAAMTGGLPRGVQEMLAPPVDWRTLLSEFVKSQCLGQDQQTWRKPHRTYLAHDLYLPTSYSDTMGKILIAVDTSGSIGDEALGQFLGHCQQLVDETSPESLDICWWGSEVVGVDEFKQGDMGGLASAVNPKGGGGTDPSCIPAWIKERVSQGISYECAIVITDGEFSANDVGKWEIPVLWLVVGNSGTEHIGIGKIIQVEEL